MYGFILVLSEVSLQLQQNQPTATYPEPVKSSAHPLTVA
jgi:hypothetical protein